MKFHREIIKEFDEFDNKSGLVVMARGLGMENLLISYLEIHSIPENLIILLNTSDLEFAMLSNKLADSTKFNSSKELEFSVENFKNIDSDTNAKARSAMYLQGGVVSVTSRILIVDMLNNTLPPNLIAGILVNHAETISEAGPLAFVLRIFRTHNKIGFIKAFSESPENFSRGINGLERMLKALQVRNISIWPRFHKVIIDEINSSGSVELIEMRISLTRKMTAIQVGILDCISQTLNELKRLYPSVKLD
jgi:DNA excision repair protein ERCC-4